jgi:D-arabinose 1-dehydrogenase-like Zn-dependent alcohol dehydrogenase
MATTKVAMAPMKAAQIPKPGRGHVLIKVQACGVCHSDALTKEGHGSF